MLAMGLKPTACTLSARRNRLSVAAGNISRSTRFAGNAAASPATAAAADDDDCGWIWSMQVAQASSKMPKKGLAARSVLVTWCSCSGAVHGANLPPDPKQFHKRV